jgi:hypothetical protein
LIEYFPCKNREELQKREGEISRKYIEKQIKIVNKRREGTYKGREKEYDAERYQENKDEILERVKNIPIF